MKAETLGGISVRMTIERVTHDGRGQPLLMGTVHAELVRAPSVWLQ